MKAPPTFNIGDPSYFVAAWTSGSARPAVLTRSKGSEGRCLFGLRFIAAQYWPSRDVIQANPSPTELVQADGMSSVIADLRYAAREFRRRPGFALTAVLSLALGIGATSAVFSVVYGVLMNPFPYVGADRIMQISLVDNAGRFRGTGLSGAQVEQLRQARTVESVVAEDGWNLTTTDGDIPEDVVASYIAPNAPNHWGNPALMGRWLIPADAPPGQDPARVVVLGYQFWQRYYTGDPAVVGRTLQLVRKDYQIVGVMPPRFRWREADIYLPLKVRLEPNIYYGVTLKIRPGVSTAEANAELQPILQQFAAQSPGRYPDNFRVHLRSIIELFARPMGPRLFLLLGAVTSLLLVGCANVSILLLVRGAHRQQELAVRAALGAGRGRIVRQLLTEAGAIAAVGAALGILIAWRGLALIVAWVPTNSFAAESVIEMNVPVLLFSTALAVITAVIFGVWPALQLSRPDLGRVAQVSARRVIGSAHGPADPSRHDCGPGRVDAVDADRRWCGRERVPAAGECRTRLRPSEHHVVADSRPRWHVPDLEGTFGVLRAAPGGRRRACRRSCRPGSRPTPRRRRTEATPRSRFSAAARSRSPLPGPTSSAPSISRSSTFRFRKDASGTLTRRGGEPPSP